MITDAELKHFGEELEKIALSPDFMTQPGSFESAGAAKDFPRNSYRMQSSMPKASGKGFFAKNISAPFRRAIGPGGRKALRFVGKVGGKAFFPGIVLMEASGAAKAARTGQAVQGLGSARSIERSMRISPSVDRFAM